MAEVPSESTATTTSPLDQVDLKRILQAIGKRSDIMLALGVVTILVVLILPLPTWLLDVGLAFSITFAVLILMTGLFVERSLEFTAFPTILLLATMIRLSWRRRKSYRSLWRVCHERQLRHRYHRICDPGHR